MTLNLKCNMPDLSVRCECGNCGWEGIAAEVGGDIEAAQERLEPGSVVPVGVCPNCHALDYLADPHGGTLPT